jgi:hypothetical protein
MKPKTVTVQAQPGRTVPFHPSVYSAGGGAGGVLKPGEEAEVNYTAEVRKGLRNGDLKIVTPKKDK